MRKFLENLIKTKEARAKELRELIKKSEDINECRSLGDTLEDVLAELAEAKAQLDELDEPAAGAGEGEGEGRNLNVLATMGQRNNGSVDTSLEKRMAFKNFIATGDKTQLRAAAGNSTGADNVGTVIPENLLNQIMENIESVGTIYNLVTKTSYPVGQTIPKEATKPVATWVGRNTETPASSTSGEGNGSTVGKGVTLDTAISFTHFKLRCEVAMTEEVATMALSSFEALFVKNVSLAMLRAIEFAIVDGDGYGMPTGILANTAPSGQAIEIAAGASNKLAYKTLCDAEAAIPAEKEAGAKWCMTKKTFMSFIGMLDSVGQPIARVNYGLGGKPERTLLGRDVILYVPQSGSKLGNYADSVDSDTLFAFIFDFNDYILNNNYDLGIQHKIDWDNEDHRTKAVAAYDGKAVDISSLVTLTKKAS